MGAKVLVVDDSTTLQRLVSSVLLDSGFEPQTVSSAEEALESLKTHPAELVLLDYVLPGMNGLAFCEALQEREELRHTPVVLMSAKGDSIRDRFIRKSGAIDAITKPFDPRGLVAVVEGALKRAAATPPRAARDEGLDEAVDSARPSAPPDPQSRPLPQLAVGLVDAVVDGLQSTIQDSGGAMPTSIVELAEMVRTSVGADALSEVLATAGIGPSTGQIALSGDLSVISIAEVLQLLHMQRQTGALEVTPGAGRKITVYLRSGNIDLATAKGVGREFLLGRYLAGKGTLPRARLRQVLRDQRSDRLLGDVLVDLGLVSAKQRTSALEQQTSEVVYELVRWAKGRFTFVADNTCPPAKSAALGLMPSGIIMEGFRRVDEWRLIEKAFDFDEVLVHDANAIEAMRHETSLTDPEEAVLKLIDGDRSVREIVEESGGSAFATCKVLYQLVNARLVRRQTA